MWVATALQGKLDRRLDLTVSMMALQVHMLADPHGDLARALGVELDTTGLLGNKRGKRYAPIFSLPLLGMV